MSSAKQYTLQPYNVIAETALAASKTSTPTEIALKDNITYQIVWTGTLNGAFSVETSMNYDPNFLTGTWDVVPIGSTAVAAGAPGSGTIELNQLGSKWVRLVFTRTSGTGNLTAQVMGKAI